MFIIIIIWTNYSFAGLFTTTTAATTFFFAQKPVCDFQSRYVVCQHFFFVSTNLLSFLCTEDREAVVVLHIPRLLAVNEMTLYCHTCEKVIKRNIFVKRVTYRYIYKHVRYHKIKKDDCEDDDNNNNKYDFDIKDNSNCKGDGINWEMVSVIHRG